MVEERASKEREWRWERKKTNKKKESRPTHIYIDTERVERDALVLKLFGTYSR